MTRGYKRRDITYEVTPTGCLLCTSHAPRSTGGGPVCSAQYPETKGGWMTVIKYLRHRAGLPAGRYFVRSCPEPRCINPHHHAPSASPYALHPATEARIVGAPTLAAARLVAKDYRIGEVRVRAIRRAAGIDDWRISVTGAELRAERLAAGASQTELAAILGIDHTSISHAEARAVGARLAGRVREALRHLAANPPARKPLGRPPGIKPTRFIRLAELRCHWCAGALRWFGTGTSTLRCADCGAVEPRATCRREARTTHERGPLHIEDTKGTP